MSGKKNQRVQACKIDHIKVQNTQINNITHTHTLTLGEILSQY